MKVLNLNKDDFESIRYGEKTALLDFYADWCGPCRVVSPIIDEIADERDDITVGKINVDSAPELAKEFGIFSIPTIIILKDGKVINKVTGARPKHKILELLDTRG